MGIQTLEQLKSLDSSMQEQNDKETVQSVKRIRQLLPTWLNSKNIKYKGASRPLPILTFEQLRDWFLAEEHLINCLYKNKVVEPLLYKRLVSRCF